MDIAIVGAGIGGLALALGLHQRGVACHVYEGAPEVREIGVGITLLPHAVRELAAPGLQTRLEALGIGNAESASTTGTSPAGWRTSCRSNRTGRSTDLAMQRIPCTRKAPAGWPRP